MPQGVGRLVAEMFHISAAAHGPRALLGDSQFLADVQVVRVAQPISRNEGIHRGAVSRGDATERIAGLDNIRSTSLPELLQSSLPAPRPPERHRPHPARRVAGRRRYSSGLSNRSHP